MLLLEDVTEFIAKRIITLRYSRNVSARELSLTIGQNKNYINIIESLATRPSIEGLVYICDYFGITLSEFFDDNKQNPLKINELVETVSKLDDGKMDLLIGVAKNFK